jgi:hypothetical protein
MNEELSLMLFKLHIFLCIAHPSFSLVKKITGRTSVTGAVYMHPGAWSYPLLMNELNN